MSSDQFLTASVRHDEDSVETSLRPRLLADFQGQTEIKENLSVFIEAAVGRNEALDHVFLNGPPGLGKTTLAGIMANELGAEFKATSAPALDKPKDLAGILTTITESSVFFIDEIHRLKPAIEEMLYTAMEDYEIDWVIGQGPAARTIRIPIPQFTLMGATTKAGNVSAPLHSRFGISIRMNYYTEAEIVQVLNRSAGILNIELNQSASALIARCSRGTPRVANRLLRRMRDFAQVMGNGTIDSDIVSIGLERLQIDLQGLEKHDREILRVIIEKYQGGPVGADTLAISIGEASETLEDYYEPYLIQRGFIKRTSRGRVVTDAAYTLLGKEAPDRDDQGLLF